MDSGTQKEHIVMLCMKGRKKVNVYLFAQLQNSFGRMDVNGTRSEAGGRQSQTNDIRSRQMNMNGRCWMIERVLPVRAVNV